MFTAVSQCLELLPIPDSGRELISQCVLLATDNVKFTLLFLQLFQQRHKPSAISRPHVKLQSCDEILEHPKHFQLFMRLPHRTTS